MSKAGSLFPLQEDHQLVIIGVLGLKEAAPCSRRAVNRTGLGLQAILKLPLLEGGGSGSGSPEQLLLATRHLAMLWLILTEAAIPKQAHSRQQPAITQALAPLLTMMQLAGQCLNCQSRACSQADSPQDNLARHWLMRMQSTRHRQGGTSAAQAINGKQKHRPLLHQTLHIIMRISRRHKARSTVGGT